MTPCRFEKRAKMSAIYDGQTCIGTVAVHEKGFTIAAVDMCLRSARQPAPVGDDKVLFQQISAKMR
jgi:hypothetical protein